MVSTVNLEIGINKIKLVIIDVEVVLFKERVFDGYPIEFGKI